MIQVLAFIVSLWLFVYTLVTMIRIGNMDNQLTKIQALLKLELRITHGKVNYCPNCLKEYGFKTWRDEPITKCIDCKSDLVSTEKV